MKRILVIALVLLFVMGAASYAATIRVSEYNFASLGWTRTLVTGAEAGQSCGFRGGYSNPQGCLPDDPEGTHPSPKKSATGQWSWAGLGINLPNGTELSTITYFHIRVTGYEGDGGSWEPPSIYLQCTKADGVNQRNLRYLPYASTSRTAAKTFVDYDMISSTAKWFNTSTGGVLTWASCLSTWPGIKLCTSGSTMMLPGGKDFNVFDGCVMNNDVTYGSSARGTVDWVDIGISGGEVTRYDFVVPEPGSILALCVGLVGLIGLRKRS